MKILPIVVLSVFLSACSGGDGLTAPTTAPALTTISEIQALMVNEQSHLRWANSGGAPTSCTLGQNQTLHDGLSLGISADRASCTITGTPTSIQPRRTYTITATNDIGSSVVMVAIEIIAQQVTSCAEGSPSAQRTRRYEVTFVSDWNAGTNGGTLPAMPGFTALVGTTHNRSYTMWSEGENASAAIEAMVETGSVFLLRGEIREAIASNQADQPITASALTSATGRTSDTFDISCDHPLVSLVIGLKGSPDWFTGVYNISLINSAKEWISPHAENLFVYDAGTKTGDRFLTTGAKENPQNLISRFMGNPIVGFNSPERAQIGRVEFKRINN